MCGIFFVMAGLFCYSHQEADTEMLYALDVSRNDPFTEMVVSC